MPSSVARALEYLAVGRRRRSRRQIGTRQDASGACAREKFPCSAARSLRRRVGARAPTLPSQADAYLAKLARAEADRRAARCCAPPFPSRERLRATPARPRL